MALFFSIISCIHWILVIFLDGDQHEVQRTWLFVFFIRKPKFTMIFFFEEKIEQFSSLTCETANCVITQILNNFKNILKIFCSRFFFSTIKMLYTLMNSISFSSIKLWIDLAWKFRKQSRLRSLLNISQYVEIETK